MVIFILGFTGPKKVVSEKELNAMVAHSLKDIPSDAEISDIDDAEVEVMFQKIRSEEELELFDTKTPLSGRTEWTTR